MHGAYPLAKACQLRQDETSEELLEWQCEAEAADPGDATDQDLTKKKAQSDKQDDQASRAQGHSASAVAADVQEGVK